MIKCRLIAFLTIFLTLTGRGVLFAQKDSSSGPPSTISGRLQESTGGAALGAEVFVYTIDGEEIVGSANTSDDNENKGRYCTGKISPGMYNVHVKYPSFIKTIIIGVPVSAAKTTTINLKLRRQDPRAEEEDTITYLSIAPKPKTPPPANSSPSKEEQNKGR